MYFLINIQRAAKWSNTLVSWIKTKELKMGFYFKKEYIYNGILFLFYFSCPHEFDGAASFTKVAYIIKNEFVTATHKAFRVHVYLCTDDPVPTRNTILSWELQSIEQSTVQHRTFKTEKWDSIRASVAKNALQDWLIALTAALLAHWLFLGPSAP